jgi:hypothetical protein
LEPEVVAKKGVARKALLLMFVNVLLRAFTPMMVRHCSSFFQAKIRLAPIDAAASAAQAASF